MPAPLTPTNLLKSRLLSGASAAVIALALSVAVAQTQAVAQVDISAAGVTTISNNNGVITSGGPGHGVIDTNTGDPLGNAPNNPAFITLTQTSTINVFDSNNGPNITSDETAQVAGALTISNGVTGTFVFGAGASDSPTFASANLEILGALNGADSTTRGGDLVLNTIPGTIGDLVDGPDPAQTFNFTAAGDTLLDAVTVTAGNAGASGGETGADLTATFGSFDVNSLTITGGNADNTSDLGGDAVVRIIDDAMVAGDIAITGGAASSNVGGNGGSATLDFETSAGTVTVQGAITIATGLDTASGGGLAGNAELQVGSAAFNAVGGVILTEQENAIAKLTLNGSALQTFNGAITANGDGQGVIEVFNDGAGVTFSSDIGSSADSIESILLNDGDNVTFEGNVFADALKVNAGVTASFEGSTSVLGGTTSDGGVIVVGNGTDAAMLTFTGDAAHTDRTTINNLGTLVIDSAGGTATVSAAVAADVPASTVTLQTIGDASDDGEFVTFSAAVTDIDTFNLEEDTVFDGDITGGDLSAATGVTATLDGTTNALTGDITGDGTLVLGVTDTLTLGATGETSTVSIANLGGDGDIEFATGSMVTIETTIGAAGPGAIGDFSMNDADTTVTINSGTTATGETAITGNSLLTLGAGTIVLGSNIGQGDTVFSFTNDAGLVTEAGATTTVQVAANVGDGDVITFAATGAVQSDAFDGVLGDGELELTQTALTEFAFAAAGNNITITATATTSAQAAATLGVSTSQADALRQAVTSATNAPDTAGLDALTTALNAGGTQATQAAQQVGPQGTTLGGGAQTAFGLMGEQQTITGNRLAGLRSTDPRFVSAFAAVGNETGFSGGDLDGPYAPLAPRYTRSVWFQAFGGVANADGDVTGAGYDAGFGGAMIGIDGAISDTVTIGAFGSYSFSTVDGDGAGNAQLDANTYQIGVYGSYTAASFYLDGFASYAGSDNDISRTAFAQTITASYDASQFAIGAAVGAPMEVSSNVFITPNASLTYNHYDADSYTETGSAGFSARVNSGSASQLTGTLGARIHAVYEQADGTSFIPELRVGIIGDLVDDDAVSTATFVGGGMAFNVTGTDTDDIGALIGLGLAMDNDSWSAGISYDADIRSDFMSHTARAEFRWNF